MLTFIRGAEGDLNTRGEVYVKVLPSGEPLQLTHDGLQKMVPVFSPDGNRIAYTVVTNQFSWDTWVVPGTRWGAAPVAAECERPSMD